MKKEIAKQNAKIVFDEHPKDYFLFHEELAYVRKLRNKGNLDKAEELLMKANPTPAVLDELRKIASTRANEAKIRNDWRAVINHLEKYTLYANQYREYCIKIVNQEPPTHTQKDLNLLHKAKLMVL